MVKFFSILSLLAIGAGFARGGVAGSLTGLVFVVGTGSGLAILVASSGTGVAREPHINLAHRIGGFVSLVGCAAGSFYGSWSRGWMWGLAGFVAGIGVTLLVGFTLQQVVKEKSQ
jgi:hypothetical protein